MGYLSSIVTIYESIFNKSDLFNAHQAFLELWPSTILNSLWPKFKRLYSAPSTYFTCEVLPVIDFVRMHGIFKAFWKSKLSHNICFCSNSPPNLLRKWNLDMMVYSTHSFLWNHEWKFWGIHPSSNFPQKPLK